MLVLTVIFVLVCLLFAFAMMRDKGKNTRFARRSHIRHLNVCEKESAIHVRTGKTEPLMH